MFCICDLSAPRPNAQQILAHIPQDKAGCFAGVIGKKYGSSPSLRYWASGLISFTIIIYIP